MNPPENLPSYKTIKRYETNNTNSDNGNYYGVDRCLESESEERFSIFNKIAIENPALKEEMESLVQHLNKLKSQRDQYKGLLDKMVSHFDQLKDGKGKIVNEYIKETSEKEEESKNLDLEYGKGISDYIDKLNFQIDYLKMKIYEESSSLKVINKKHDDLPESKDLSQILSIDQEVNHHHENDKVNMSIPELHQGKKTHQKWTSVDFQHHKKRQSNDYNTTKTSIQDVQAFLDYFPQRIRELEEENHQMMEFINNMQNAEQVKEKEVVKEKINERMNSNSLQKEEILQLLNELITKQKEMEEKAQNLDEQHHLLLLKQQELELKENQLKSKQTNQEDHLLKPPSENSAVGSYLKNSLHQPDLLLSDSSTKPKPIRKENEPLPKQQNMPFCSSCRIY